MQPCWGQGVGGSNMVGAGKHSSVPSSGLLWEPHISIAVQHTLALQVCQRHQIGGLSGGYVPKTEHLSFGESHFNYLPKFPIRATSFGRWYDKHMVICSTNPDVECVEIEVWSKGLSESSEEELIKSQWGGLEKSEIRCWCHRLTGISQGAGQRGALVMGTQPFVKVSRDRRAMESRGVRIWSPWLIQGIRSLFERQWKALEGLLEKRKCHC